MFRSKNKTNKPNSIKKKTDLNTKEKKQMNNNMDEIELKNVQQNLMAYVLLKLPNLEFCFYGSIA